MSKYSTIVVVSRDIYTKIELYREILEKSEFGTMLEKAKFISDDSAEELSSAALNNAENTFYLYGLLCKDKYAEYHKQIEEQRKIYQNSNHYMLFCCKKYCEEGSFDVSEKANQSVNRVFAFGIVEDEKPQKQTREGLVELTEEESEDVRCIKLICTVLAICPHADQHKSKKFDTYYTLADVQISYKHIYFSVLHKLSKYGDMMDEVQANINTHKEVIRELQERKPVICKGNYAPGGPETETLKPFSEYGNMEELRRSLEVAYGNGVKSVRKFVAGKINVARLAMAEAEEHRPVTFVKEEGGSVAEVIVSDEKPQYMSLNDVGKSGEIHPDKILERPESSASFDAVKLGAALPLAKEFEKRERPSFGKTLLATSVCVLLFAVFVATVYLARYLKSGFNGVDWYDFAIVVGVPSAVICAAGLVTLIIQLIQSIYCKSVFKQLYKSLKEFLAAAGIRCEAIKQYIDVYLTVFYNHHIKYARIKKITNEITGLEDDIRKIEEQIKPVNSLADKIYRLFGGMIDVPENEVDREGRIIRTATSIIEEEIIEYAKSAPENIPWLNGFKHSAGNMNGGIQ